MSDRRDTPYLDLLERADELSPPMSVEPEAVIAAGRRKLRRRRMSAASGFGAVALVGALWLGGPLHPFAPGDPPAPASISWQEGIDVELFDISPHPVHEPDRTSWTGQLRSSEGDAFPELVLIRNGVQLEPVAAQDGPGDVMVFHLDGLSVAAWQPPAGSVGESPLWSPGVYASQGGDVQISGADLRYAVAEFVPGASAELEELYWFTGEAAHAASGAPVESAVLASEQSSPVVMVDEAREVWGMVRQTEHGAMTHVEPLVAGSGLSGWTGEDVVGTAVGVLPPGATTPSVDAETASLVTTALGSHTAVLAIDTTGQRLAGTGTTVIGPDGAVATYAPPPTVRFTLDGTERVLESFAQDVGRTLDVGRGEVLVTAQPEALELRRGEKWHLIPAEELQDASAFAAPVLGGHAVVVPGWDPGVATENLRVLVGSDEGERWVEAESAYVDALFDGRSLVVLGVGAGVVEEGESVRGVGVAPGGDVVRHALDEVVTLDVSL